MTDPRHHIEKIIGEIIEECLADTIAEALNSRESKLYGDESEVTYEVIEGK
jgi:hypothetical protein